MKSALAIAIALVASTTAFAQPEVPIRAAPQFSVVRKTTPEKGHAELVRYVIVFNVVRVVVKVNRNGMLVDENREEQRPLIKEVQAVYDLANSRVITPDGKQLPIDEVWKRLKPNTVVAVSGDFDTPAAPYLRALAAETLVIIPAPPKALPLPKKE